MIRSTLRFLAIAFALAAPFTAARAAGDLMIVNSTATIASGASLSGAIDLGAGRIFAVSMPAAWTAAALTFQASPDGATYSNLYDDTGTEVSVTAAASQYIVISVPAKWIGIRWIKVRSGTSGTAVNQGADRIVTVVSVP